MADEAYFDQDSNADSNKKSPNILRKRFRHVFCIFIPFLMDVVVLFQSPHCSAFQLDILEDAFQNHNYLNADILDDLHHRLRLSENQIKIWFRVCLFLCQFLIMLSANVSYLNGQFTFV